MDIHYKLVREIDSLPPGRKDIHIPPAAVSLLAEWIADAVWPPVPFLEAMNKIVDGKFYLLGKQVKVQ